MREWLWNLTHRAYEFSKPGVGVAAMSWHKWSPDKVHIHMQPSGMKDYCLGIGDLELMKSVIESMVDAVDNVAMRNIAEDYVHGRQAIL